MKIHNIRIGFANNSSSSHSILLLPDETKAQDDYEPSNFGWSFFTLASPEAKENYLICSVFQNLQNYSKHQRAMIIYNVFGNTEKIKGYVSELEKGVEGVDHQSILTFPNNHQGKINEEFIKQYVNEILTNPNLVICGGNDNTATDHELDSVGTKSKLWNLPKESDSKDYLSIRNGEYWTIFNPSTGGKISLEFDTAPPPALYIPELVDVKITDFCPFACKFCYQDSTTMGNHASFSNLKQIAKKLGNVGVLEVALGGGEPTMHPDFVNILKEFRSNQIVPNFTTKTLAWAKKNPEIVEICGSFAVSVENVNEVEKNIQLYKTFVPFFIQNAELKDVKSKMNFQYVMGTTPLEQLNKILKHLSTDSEKYPITLLGYKENGRGKDVVPHNYDNWIDVVKKYKGLLDGGYIKIDTALAAQSKDILEKYKVSKNSYHTSEGLYSMYIDALKMNMYPSSYIGLHKETSFSKDWLDKYQNIAVDAVDFVKKIKI